MKDKLARLTPPGIRWQTELKLWAWLAGAAAVYSFAFFFELAEEISRLYHTPYPGAARQLREGWMMPYFAELAQGRFRLFPLVLLAMLLTAAGNYLSFFRGSKSIYLMRRLPQRGETARRCLGLPLLLAGATLLLAGLLLLMDYLIYTLAVPSACLAPGQWDMVMDWILGG